MSLQIALMIVIVGGVTIFVMTRIFRSLKMKEAKQEFQNFLYRLSESFHTAKWVALNTYVGPDRTNEVIAEEINCKLRSDMASSFNSLIMGLYHIPNNCITKFSEDEDTYRFVSKTVPIIWGLHQNYKFNEASIACTNSEFFNHTKDIILKWLNEDEKN